MIDDRPPMLCVVEPFGLDEGAELAVQLAGRVFARARRRPVLIDADASGRLPDLLPPGAAERDGLATVVAHLAGAGDGPPPPSERGPARFLPRGPDLAGAWGDLARVVTDTGFCVDVPERLRAALHALAPRRALIAVAGSELIGVSAALCGASDLVVVVVRGSPSAAAGRAVFDQLARIQTLRAPSSPRVVVLSRAGEARPRGAPTKVGALHWSGPDDVGALEEILEFARA